MEGRNDLFDNTIIRQFNYLHSSDAENPGPENPPPHSPEPLLTPAELSEPASPGRAVTPT